MPLKLMYITNRPEIAQIAQSAGVDRIFVDMEYIGKSVRQGGMDTVQSHHTIEDIAAVKQAVTSSELLVRVNPIHNTTEDYCSSKEEIDAAISAGADILMLPYFKTVEEVEIFLALVDGRAKTMPLLETTEAVRLVDKILELKGLDEIFIGLNDLSLGYGKKFMFELLSDGTVEDLCYRFRKKGIPFGFGGIAALGKGMLPSEYIIREHYRLESSCAILSRSFCDTTKIGDLDIIRSTFNDGVAQIRALEEECRVHSEYFTHNKLVVAEKIAAVVAEKE